MQSVGISRDFVDRISITAPLALFPVDPDQHIRRSNQAAQQLHGGNPDGERIDLLLTHRRVTKVSGIPPAATPFRYRPRFPKDFRPATRWPWFGLRPRRPDPAESRGERPDTAGKVATGSHRSRHPATPGREKNNPIRQHWPDRHAIGASRSSVIEILDPFEAGTTDSLASTRHEWCAPGVDS